MLAREPSRDSPKPSLSFVRPALRIIVSLFLMVAAGTAVFYVPGVTTRPWELTEAMFTAVSALTVTGLTVITPSQDLTTAGQVVLMILIQIGGVGYMTLAVMMFRFIGRQITLADRLALRDQLGLVSVQGVADLARRIFITVLCIELVGMVLLLVVWAPDMEFLRALHFSAFHAVSGFCNAGFDLFTMHPDHLEGFPADPATLAIMSGLIVFGSLGIPILFDFIGYRKTGQLTLHTRMTVPLILTLNAIGAGAFYVAEAMAGGTLVDETPARAAMFSVFQSISSRSAGFIASPNFDQIEPTSSLLMMALMAIGGAPASMGGGITTGTFAVMVLALLAYARGRDTAIIKGRAIPGEMVRKASAVLTISILVVVTVTWLIALTHPGSLEEIAFEVISAFATCGLSLGFTENLNTFGRLLIMFMMFWGRAGALTVIVSLAQLSPPRRIRYPEERILIG
jgi:trk system potassium uptake protein